jgi:hypothetical protein
MFRDPSRPVGSSRGGAAILRPLPYPRTAGNSQSAKQPDNVVMAKRASGDCDN